MAGDGEEDPVAAGLALIVVRRVGAGSVVRPIDLTHILFPVTVVIGHVVVHRAEEVNDLFELAVLTARILRAAALAVRAVTPPQTGDPAAAGLRGPSHTTTRTR